MNAHVNGDVTLSTLDRGFPRSHCGWWRYGRRHSVGRQSDVDQRGVVPLQQSDFGRCDGELQARSTWGRSRRDQPDSRRAGRSITTDRSSMQGISRFRPAATLGVIRARLTSLTERRSIPSVERTSPCINNPGICRWARSARVTTCGSRRRRGHHQSQFVLRVARRWRRTVGGAVPWRERPDPQC